MTTTAEWKTPRTIRADGTTVRLERIRHEDRDAVLAFARGLDERDLLFLRMDITRPDVVDDWIASQEDDQRVTLLAWKGEELLGYGSLNRQPLSWTRHMGEIRVIVRADMRRTGLGRALAHEVFEVAKAMGLRKVVARMPLRQEGARRMFERLGFSAEALLADWVVDRDGNTQDLVVMTYDMTGLTG